MDFFTGEPIGQTVTGTLNATPGATVGTASQPFSAVYAETGDFTDINVTGNINNAALQADLTDLDNKIGDIIDDNVTALTSTWSSSKIDATYNFAPGAFATDLIPDLDDTRDIGAPSKRIKTFHASTVDTGNLNTSIGAEINGPNGLLVEEGVSATGVYALDFVSADTVTARTTLECKGSSTGINHTDLANIGTNTHAQIDTHIGNALLHFEQTDIDHVNLLNKGTNTHAQIDTHIGNALIHFEQKDIDHVNLLNKGTNTHAQIDTALASQGANISALLTRTQNLAATAGNTTVTGNITITGSEEVKANQIVRGALQVDGAATVGGFPVATSTDIGILNTKTQNITATAGNTVFTGTTSGLNHLNLSNIGTNTHAQIDTHIGNALVHFEQKDIDHVNILNKGTNTHAQIDTNLATLNTKTQNITATVGNTTFTGTTSGLNHLNLSNIGTNTHAQIDTHIGNALLHFEQKDIDHVNLLNKGTNTHAQIDTNLTTLNTKTQNQTATSGLTTFTTDLGIQGTNRYEMRSNGPDFGLYAVPNAGSILAFATGTANLTTPIIRGLYIGPGTRPVVTSGYVQTGNSAILSNSVTETSIIGPGIGTLTIPANTMTIGSCTTVRIMGIFDQSANNQQITLRLRGSVGGVTGTVWTTHVVPLDLDVPAGSAWQWDITITCQLAGGGGIITTHSHARFGTASSTQSINQSISTTISNTISITAQWGAATATNSIYSTQLISTNLYQPTA